MWKVVRFWPGDRPFHSLAAALLPLLDFSLSETDSLVEMNKLAERLRHKDLLLRDILERIYQKQNCSLLLALDQFEELYTLCADAEVRHQFLDTLFETFSPQQNGLKPQCAMVLTLRADFLGQALAHRAFAGLAERMVNDVENEPGN